LKKLGGWRNQKRKGNKKDRAPSCKSKSAMAQQPQKGRRRSENPARLAWGRKKEEGEARGIRQNAVTIIQYVSREREPEPEE